jgi:catalase
VRIIAPKIGDANLAGGSLLKIDGQLAGTPSVMFDAVAIIFSEKTATILGKEAAAIEQDAGVIAIGTLYPFIVAAKTTRQKTRLIKMAFPLNVEVLFFQA